MSVLEVEGLVVEARRGAGVLRLVDGVEFTLGAGELLGIMGESGAGKTLTTRALVGLLPPGVRAQGRVRLGERRFDARAATAARATLVEDAAVVLQNPMTALDPLQRVGAQIVEGAVRHRVLAKDAARERAVALLARLGFVDPTQVMALYPHQLSGGMAQRVLIASALMTRPSLLIVDEPTSALDANVRVEVLRLLRAVAREEGAGVLLVSHDLALVSAFCDRIMVMYAGRALESGPAAAVLAHPQHPYTRALLACSPSSESRPRKHLPAVPGVPPRPGEWPVGCVFVTRCPIAVDRCRSVRPLLVERGEAAAACHLAGALEPCA